MHQPESMEVYSSEGRLIRDNLSQEEVYSSWVEMKDYPKELIDLVVFSEDKRFYYHLGFDAFAIGRSIIQNLSSGKIISGASTIPQQLSRILWKEKMPKQKVLRKVFELFYSVSISLRFSKDQILESYLNNVPFSGQIVGFSNASKLILGKNIQFLSKEELIFLVVLVRNPNARDESIFNRFQKLAKEFCSLECRTDISFDNLLNDYKKNRVQVSGSSLHFHDWIAGLHRKGGKVYTHFSETINSNLNKILQNELNYLSEYKVEQGSVVVLKIDQESKQKIKLISFLGSRNYFNHSEGQVKGNLALRNAGSTLKPFVYGLGMEKMGWHPETIFQDEDKSFRTMDGTHRPKNNDLKYWGRITLREALGTSRNLTATNALEKLGVERFYLFLKSMGLSHLSEPPEYYGTGLALGVGEINLLQLTRLYSALALGGVMEPVSLGKYLEEEINYGKREIMFSSKNSCILTHILSDKGIRKRAFGKRSFLDFPYDVAVKTGTSKDYRDSWTVGYTDKYVIGVWVGNFSGKPMQRISGSFGAGRIFQQIVRHLHSTVKPKFKCFEDFQKVSLCRISGDLAQKTCPYYTEIAVQDQARMNCKILHRRGEEYSFNVDLEVLSPAEGEIYKKEKSFPKSKQLIPLRILAPKEGNWTYTIDEGRPIPFSGNLESFLELKEGRHSLKIFMEKKQIKEIQFEIR